MDTQEQPVEKKKHVVTPEHKAKMIEGRKKYWEQKNAEKQTKPQAPEIVVKDSPSSIKIFGDVDRDARGNIKSEMPAYYFDERHEDLKRVVSETQRQLDDDAVPQPARARVREALRARKERMQRIEESKPILNDRSREEFGKLRKDLGEKLKESHASQSELDKRLVDAHEEARRMKEPCIKIESDKMAKMAQECGVRIVNGKISRDGADKMWKITSKILGEPTDVEYLRRRG